MGGAGQGGVSIPGATIAVWGVDNLCRGSPRDTYFLTDSTAARICKLSLLRRVKMWKLLFSLVNSVV